MPTPILDHVGYPVSNFAMAKAFYAKALAPLGIKPIMEVTNEMTGGHGEHVGFGIDKPDFWISTGKTANSGIHVAFMAKDHTTVDAFYRAAMEAGGKDNGPPGMRPHYHKDYYGAFVLDPDGNNVEAVCHTAE
jgi:catechol 2,3-dioxygenase-like lactoylglutathione lyase family enzyme